MAKKNGKDNLKVPTSEQAREYGRRGGLTRAANERKRKTMREALEMMMFEVELDKDLKDRLVQQGIKDQSHFNHQMVVTRSLIAKAESGDVQAYNAICAMIGEKPAETMELSGGMQTELKITHITRNPDDADFPSSEDEVDVER